MPALSPSVVPINVASLVLQALDDTETLTLVLMQAPESRLGLSIMATNGAFERAFGYQPGACVGWGLDIITGVESDPATIARIRAAAHSGTRAEGEFLAITRNGGSLWFGFHLMPVTEARGQFVLIGRDITQKYVAERAERSVNQLLAAVFARVDVPVLICDDWDGIWRPWCRRWCRGWRRNWGTRCGPMARRPRLCVTPCWRTEPNRAAV
jgi:PAS domain S-box-containing protein